MVGKITLHSDQKYHKNQRGSKPIMQYEYDSYLYDLDVFTSDFYDISDIDDALYCKAKIRTKNFLS